MKTVLKEMGMLLKVIYSNLVLIILLIIACFTPLWANLAVQFLLPKNWQLREILLSSTEMSNVYILILQVILIIGLFFFLIGIILSPYLDRNKSEKT